MKEKEINAVNKIKDMGAILENQKKREKKTKLPLGPISMCTRHIQMYSPIK
jgi:hypothetical protein